MRLKFRGIGAGMGLKPTSVVGAVAVIEILAVNDSRRLKAGAGVGLSRRPADMESEQGMLPVSSDVKKRASD